MMDRRTFIVSLAGGVLAAPPADAQTLSRVYRIGVLCLTSCDGSEVDAFRLELRDFGYVEGRTVKFEYRAAEGNLDRLPALAADLVDIKVDVIFTPFGTAAPLAAKHATTTIPVVMGAAGDPVNAGIVQSLAKPGANVTGLSSAALDLEAKRLALLKELVPEVSRIGVFWDPQNSYSVLAMKQEEMAARTIGVQLRMVPLHGKSDLDSAFAALTRDRVDALCVQGYAAALENRAAIIAFAAAKRIPAIYPNRGYVTEGGLVAYGVNLAENSRRAARYVDKILRGAKPTDLPVEQPTKFELVINLKTAKVLGITILQSLLLRADELIQ